jgi:hypothetical protein
MNKIYYFFDRENEQCYFFNNEECASFYRELTGAYYPINFFNIKSDDFEGTDVFTLQSFKQQLLKELELDTESDEAESIREFLKVLDNRLREEKLNKLLNEKYDNLYSYMGR